MLYATLVQCTTPKNDAFYNMITLSASQNPGDIIDHRPANLTTAFGPAVPVVNQTWTVKYVTNSADGTKTAAVMTIIIPFGTTGQILSYQPAYDSPNLDCSPSYQLGQNPVLGLITEPIAIEKGLIASALQKGWTVIVPDYEGLTAAFTSGLTSGRAVLDGITAAYNSGRSFTSISSNAPVALLGYSGGALATEWAGEIQATYVPSLSSTLVGVAAGGLPVNINNTIAKVNGANNSGGANAGLIPNALLGLASTFPAFSSFLTSSLKPETINSFRYTLSTCNFADYYKQTPDIFATYFKPNATLAAFTSSNQYKSVLNSAGIMGLHGRPTQPTYFFQGAQDEIVSADATTALVQKYCAMSGISLEYTLNPNTNHSGESISGIGAAIQFIQDRFNKVPPIVGCVYNSAEPS